MGSTDKIMANFEKEISDITERAERYSRESLDRSMKESQEHMDRMDRFTKELDNKSIQNFAAWRDYLHKYFVLILAFIGGTGIFSAHSSTTSPMMVYGVFLALAGLVIGFITINLHFYFERKWLQISNYVASSGFNEIHEHPDVENDPAAAAKLNIKDKIAEFKIQLQAARAKKDQKKISSLKTLIRGHKMEMHLMKYLGQQFGWIEIFWIVSVLVSMTFTTLGIILIFGAIF